MRFSATRLIKYLTVQQHEQFLAADRCTLVHSAALLDQFRLSIRNKSESPVKNLQNRELPVTLRIINKLKL